MDEGQDTESRDVPVDQGEPDKEELSDGSFDNNRGSPSVVWDQDTESGDVKVKQGEPEDDKELTDGSSDRGEEDPTDS